MGVCPTLNLPSYDTCICDSSKQVIDNVFHSAVGICDHPIIKVSTRVDGSPDIGPKFTFDASAEYDNTISLCSTFEDRVTLTDIYLVLDDPEQQLMWNVQDADGTQIGGVSHLIIVIGTN